MAAGLALAVATAQTPNADPVTAVLTHGQLTIWVVTPAPANWSTDLDVARTHQQSGVGVLPKTIQQHTMADFGTNAGSYGTNAGDYGKPGSEVGQNAGNVGQNAGSYGTASGSFGASAGSVGQNAGSYGQTAGSFGYDPAAYGVNSNMPQPGVRRPSSRLHAEATDSSIWTAVASPVASAYPGLKITVAEVAEQNLLGELEMARAASRYPDVLVGSPLPWRWAGKNGSVAKQLVVAPLGLPLARENEAEAFRDVVILRGSPHPETARAYVAWLQDGTVCTTCLPRTQAAAIAAAENAYASLLQGSGLGGEADLRAASFSTGEGMRGALEDAWGAPLTGLQIWPSAISAAGNDQLAVVELRAVASAPDAFGVLHGVAILRRNRQGAWRVLELSPSLSRSAMHDERRTLAAFTQAAKPAQVKGVALAAPVNGDVRPPTPELWWDNRGGAGLQVVEWQHHNAQGWSAPDVMLVPDDGAILRTRVTAAFATQQGAYRWRVWSVGDGGAMVFSPWWTFTVAK